MMIVIDLMGDEDTIVVHDEEPKVKPQERPLEIPQPELQIVPIEIT